MWLGVSVLGTVTSRRQRRMDPGRRQTPFASLLWTIDWPLPLVPRLIREQMEKSYSIWSLRCITAFRTGLLQNRKLKTRRRAVAAEFLKLAGRVRLRGWKRSLRLRAAVGWKTEE